jgi:hypothetical protein
MQTGKWEWGMGKSKPIEEVTVEDLSRFPVWEFALDEEDEHDETWVRPVLRLPVKDLANRVIGAKVRLANGLEKWAVLSNVSLRNPRQTKEFLSLGVELGNQWLDLARYFDVDVARNGPKAFADRLGLSISEVFPITYDISGIAVGHADVLKGEITAQPSIQLTKDARMKLIFEKD